MVVSPSLRHIRLHTIDVIDIIESQVQENIGESPFFSLLAFPVSAGRPATKGFPIACRIRWGAKGVVFLAFCFWFAVLGPRGRVCQAGRQSQVACRDDWALLLHEQPKCSWIFLRHLPILPPLSPLELVSGFGLLNRRTHGA